MIKAEIKNCNNIISTDIHLKKNHLNIRYAMNGTGKSTIATAIELQSKQEDLSDLKCFGSAVEPTCTFSENINKVLLFNDDFVNNIVFQQSEVIQNSFDVFIRTPQYEERQSSINSRLKNIHVDISENKELQQLVLVGKTVLSKFSLTQGGELQQRGMIKSLTSSKSIFTLPKELSKFQPLMQRNYNVDWVGWKNDGAKYDDVGICPFCTSSLGEQYQTEKKVFTASYSQSNVKNIMDMISYFETVKDYMDEGKKDILYNCVKGSKDTREIQLWIKKFYTELKFLVEEIAEVQEFNSFKVRREDITQLDVQLKNLTIDISNLEIFTNAKVKTLITFINKKIDEVLAEIELLKKDIGELKGFIGTAKERYSL